MPPDNYQGDRKPKIVNRTSSTNIGLGMLSIISAYDLGFESLEDTVNLLEKMVNTVNCLSKWNGHLYNWYNIETLEPLIPRFVSSVDSGNLIGYLYVVKQFLESVENYKTSKILPEFEKISVESINDDLICKIKDIKQQISVSQTNEEKSSSYQDIYYYFAIPLAILLIVNFILQKRRL